MAKDNWIGIVENLDGNSVYFEAQLAHSSSGTLLSPSALLGNISGTVLSGGNDGDNGGGTDESSMG